MSLTISAKHLNGQHVYCFVSFPNSAIPCTGSSLLVLLTLLRYVLSANRICEPHAFIAFHSLTNSEVADSIYGNVEHSPWSTGALLAVIVCSCIPSEVHVKISTTVSILLFTSRRLLSLSVRPSNLLCMRSTSLPWSLSRYGEAWEQVMAWHMWGWFEVVRSLPCCKGSQTMPVLPYTL